MLFGYSITSLTGKMERRVPAKSPAKMRRGFKDNEVSDKESGCPVKNRNDDEKALGEL